MPTIEEILQKAEASEKTELTILHNAYVTALSGVRTAASEANLRTYRAAKDALDRLTEKLSARYFPKEDPEPVFESRIEALKHLKGLGYKVGKSKFYKDAGEGLVRFESDGKINQKSLDRYIRLSGIRRFSEIGQNKGEEKDSVLYEKAEQEVEKLKEQVRELRKKNEILEGQYFRKSDFEMELAARAAVFESELKQNFRTHAERLTAVVSGDSNRAMAVAEALETILDRALRNLADTSRFHVIFESGPVRIAEAADEAGR